MTAAEQRLPHLLAEISTTALAADPLMLYSRLHVFDAMRRSSLTDAESFGSDALLEFYGGLVTAMPAEQVLQRLGADQHPQALFDLDGLLREYGAAENLAHQGRVLREGAADAQSSVLHQLQFEHRFDRMLGYPAQLRPIFDAIVSPLAEQARKVIGFALHHALDAADAFQAVRVAQMNEILDAFEGVIAASAAAADPVALGHYAAVHASRVATFGAAPVEDDLPGLLAERTGTSRDAMVQLVAALATPLGSQPKLRVLTDINTLRRRPIIGLGDGRYLWARPGDFLHDALDWVVDVCRDHPELLARFDKRRQDTCEELAHRALTAVFGADDVHGGVTYPADGSRPDIDVLVATPGAALVVEAKGGRFTDPARRAAPDRVKRKTREFVDKALEQNARTIAHLTSEATDLRAKTKRRLTLPDISSPVSVIITLDRVDPFATHLPDGGKRGAVPEAGTWLVTLADFLMVADILQHPVEFYAYARARAAITKAGGPKVFVEADALANWLEHRIQPCTPRPGTLTFLDPNCDAVNSYYTHIATDAVLSAVRPTTGVPPEILHALDGVLRDRPEHWHDLAVAVMAVPPRDWQRVRKALQAPAVKTATRRDRKRARRAAGGIRLSPDLTVYVHDGPTEDPSQHTGPDALLVSIDKRLKERQEAVPG